MRLFTNRGLGPAKELLKAALETTEAGEFGRGEELAREAARLWTRAGRRGVEGLAVSRAVLVKAVRHQGRLAEAGEELQAGLAAPGITGSGEAALRIELADALRAELRHAEALDVIGRVLAVAGTTRWRLKGRQQQALVLGELGRHRQAVEVLADLAAEARRGAQSEFALAIDSNRLAQLSYLGEHAEVDTEAPRMRAAAGTVAEPGATLVRLAGGNTLAVSLALRGRHVEAERLLRESLAESGLPGPFALTLNVNLSRALLGQGFTDAAVEAVDAARAIADGMPALSNDNRSALGLAAVNLHLALEQPAEAEQQAREALTRCADAPSHRVLELRTVLGLAKLRQGRGDSTLAGAVADWRAYFGEEHHGTVAAREALAG
ncbi:hypothetical protein TR51_14025 [Kitasatospora griseola]|uniref:MalT-like TPR region domain-containing protein n=1 Tax=Kitasatospora griseola TaxID=2064 RepID=A0A0D0P0R8_KITGR|nr:hypothetical protein [Kitasatospora griseola]KIQ65126.1 hypothetical protein TR51_14025 [Kitasatospora griseola]